MEDEVATYQTCYVIFYSEGPNWRHGVSFWEQVGIDEHAAYMETLLKQGTLIMGGPFIDGSGGMAILRTNDLVEAEEIVDNDPAVNAGTLSAKLRQWQVPISSIRFHHS